MKKLGFVVVAALAAGCAPGGGGGGGGGVVLPYEVEPLSVDGAPACDLFAWCQGTDGTLFAAAPREDGTGVCLRPAAEPFPENQGGWCVLAASVAAVEAEPCRDDLQGISLAWGYSTSEGFDVRPAPGSATEWGVGCEAGERWAAGMRTVEGERLRFDNEGRLIP